MNAPPKAPPPKAGEVPLGKTGVPVKAMPKQPTRPKAFEPNHDLNYLMQNTTCVIEELPPEIEEDVPQNTVAIPVPKRQQQFKTYEAALKRQRQQ